ncbi:hypothetical protein ONZ43_g4792 [Nemania bipapillata]|uniref:Uncharacterized protein n=1 Tax=Nemania bipapillata TaxID=110536 RepID=A0ACC2IIC8_9PEZI|nr:hypothetical protein ONZ43_g4792 [Nemania bipapillata]
MSELFETKDSIVLRLSDRWSVFTEFPIIKNEEDAFNFLATYGLAKCKHTVTLSKPLWGRVKWMAMYAEKIAGKLDKTGEAEVSAPQDPDQESFFSTVVEETYNDIVEVMCARLESLRERAGTQKLMDTLLDAAISADVLDRPHVFYQESDMVLVEQGFAMVGYRIDELARELGSTFDITRKSRAHGTATLRQPGQPSDIIIADMLAKVADTKFSIAGLAINKLTPDMARGGFTIIDRTIDKMAAELEALDLMVIRKPAGGLNARLAKDHTLREDRQKKFKELLSRFTLKPNTNTDPIKDLGGNGVDFENSTVRTAYRDDLLKRNKFAFQETPYGFKIHGFETTPIGNDIHPSMVKSVLSMLVNVGFIVVSKTFDELQRAAVEGYTIIDCTSTSLTKRMRDEGFAVWKDVGTGDMGSILQEINLQIVSETEELFIVKEIENDDTLNTSEEQLECRLVEMGLVFDEKTKSSLVATLAERVVIEAIICFSLKQSPDRVFRLNLLSTRTGLGHSAEHYLALVSV